MLALTCQVPAPEAVLCLVAVVHSVSPSERHQSRALAHHSPPGHYHLEGIEKTLGLKSLTYVKEDGDRICGTCLAPGYPWHARCCLSPRFL